MENTSSRRGAHRIGEDARFLLPIILSLRAKDDTAGELRALLLTHEGLAQLLLDPATAVSRREHDRVAFGFSFSVVFFFAFRGRGERVGDSQTGASRVKPPPNVEHLGTVAVVHLRAITQPMDARLDPTDPSLFFVSSGGNDADRPLRQTRLLASMSPMAPFETTSKSKSKQVLPPRDHADDEMDKVDVCIRDALTSERAVEKNACR